MQQIDEAKALSRLQTLCAKAEKCTADCELKLAQWRIPADARRRIIDRLVAERYVDDARYASAFVHDKWLSGWGPRKVEHAMAAKRLPATLIDDALATIEQQQWEDNLARKARSLLPREASSPAERRAKAIRRALQQGFDYDMAARHIDREMEREGEEE